ncbi:hypothetical protein KHO57_gp188 [Mycobacterium phage Phabba]|uniref:Uncharacterized protein n=1 Tax=Mycobacterium phage Phabba TaxID=2027899 RepID=A0A249XSN5_9CAUD|nr:hypothetical protein KHO57_gp188 [Mycobacterium phage Phabba]ASZ74716.1 hypothetical protein SEA_PHABBA_147 [Mycobacterium phage Phabba]
METYGDPVYDDEGTDYLNDYFGGE